MKNKTSRPQRLHDLVVNLFEAMFRGAPVREEALPQPPAPSIDRHTGLSEHPTTWTLPSEATLHAIFHPSLATDLVKSPARSQHSGCFCSYVLSRIQSRLSIDPMHDKPRDCLDLRLKLGRIFSVSYTNRVYTEINATLTKTKEKRVGALIRTRPLVLEVEKARASDFVTELTQTT
jgi:hypothetical protein